MLIFLVLFSSLAIVSNAFASAQRIRVTANNHNLFINIPNLKAE